MLTNHRNRNLNTFKASIKSQAQVTCLFTSAASNQSPQYRPSPWEV